MAQCHFQKATAPKSKADCTANGRGCWDWVAKRGNTKNSMTACGQKQPLHNGCFAVLYFGESIIVSACSAALDQLACVPLTCNDRAENLFDRGL